MYGADFQYQHSLSVSFQIEAIGFTYEQRIFHFVRCAGIGNLLHTYEQREQATNIADTEYFTGVGSVLPGRPMQTDEQKEQAFKERERES